MIAKHHGDRGTKLVYNWNPVLTCMHYRGSHTEHLKNSCCDRDVDTCDINANRDLT